MKEEIVKIIHGDPKIEPIVLLDSRYRQLSDENQREEFLLALKDLSVNGTIEERFASLYIIDMIEKAKECESEIKINIEKFDFKKDEKLIIPLLSLCATLSVDWSINFIRTIIKCFKPKGKNRSYYFDIGLRNIITTIYWRSTLFEIEWAMEKYEDRYVIDLIAYFRWKRGINDIENLLNLISDNPALYSRIKELEPKIFDRYISNYAKINMKE